MVNNTTIIRLLTPIYPQLNLVFTKSKSHLHGYCVLLFLWSFWTIICPMYQLFGQNFIIFAQYDLLFVFHLHICFSSYIQLHMPTPDSKFDGTISICALNTIFHGTKSAFHFLRFCFSCLFLYLKLSSYLFFVSYIIQLFTHLHLLHSDTFLHKLLYHTFYSRQ